MRLSRTVFEIISLIFQKLKKSRNSDHAPFRDKIVIRRLGLAMFNPHITFEMSTITCYEEMKGNDKCKNFPF